MRRLCVLLVLAGSLSGCAARSYEEASAQRGAVIGAGTGAVIGGLTGRSPGSVLAGGIIGGIAGGALGAAAASPPPPPPPGVYVEGPDPDTCYVRARSGRLRPVPCE